MIMVIGIGELERRLGILTRDENDFSFVPCIICNRVY